MPRKHSGHCPLFIGESEFPAVVGDAGLLTKLTYKFKQRAEQPVLATREIVGGTALALYQSDRRLTEEIYAATRGSLTFVHLSCKCSRSAKTTGPLLHLPQLAAVMIRGCASGANDT